MSKQERQKSFSPYSELVHSEVLPHTNRQNLPELFNKKDLNERKHLKLLQKKKTKSKVLQLFEILSLSDVIMSDIENTFGRLGTFGNCKAQIDWFTHTSSNDPVSPSALRGFCNESSGFITCLCSFTVFNYCLLYWFSITHSQLFTRKCIRVSSAFY